MYYYSIFATAFQVHPPISFRQNGRDGLRRPLPQEHGIFRPFFQAFPFQRTPCPIRHIRKVAIGRQRGYITENTNSTGSIMNDAVHIAIASDRRYLPLAAVALCSAAENTSRELVIHFLYEDLEEAARSSSF